MWQHQRDVFAPEGKKEQQEGDNAEDDCDRKKENDLKEIDDLPFQCIQFYLLLVKIRNGPFQQTDFRDGHSGLMTIEEKRSYSEQ